MNRILLLSTILRTSSRSIGLCGNRELKVYAVQTQWVRHRKLLQIYPGSHNPPIRIHALLLRLRQSHFQEKPINQWLKKRKPHQCIPTRKKSLPKHPLLFQIPEKFSVLIQDMMMQDGCRQDVIRNLTIPRTGFESRNKKQTQKWNKTPNKNAKKILT